MYCIKCKEKLVNPVDLQGVYCPNEDCERYGLFTFVVDDESGMSNV